MDKATINQNIQLGKENPAARGTAVAASRLLQSLNINLSPELTSREIRARGNKLASRMAPGRRSTTGGIDESAAVFGEVCYPLESILGIKTPTTPAGATLARERLYKMNTRAADNFQTYTFERGIGSTGERATYATFTGMTMEFTSEAINITGDLVARPLEKGITMTASPTALPLVPMDPMSVAIYVDDEYDNIGTTVMERLISGTWTVSGKQAPQYVVNRHNAHKSFVSMLEQQVDATLGLVLVANSQSDQFLQKYDDGDLVYVRIEVLGTEIEEDQPHLFQVDIAASVENLTEADSDNAWAATWGFRIVDEAVDLAGIEILVRNGVATL